MFILVSKFAMNVFNDCLERKKPVKLLDLLKHANASRNKQAHRMTSDSKKGRQFISDPNKFTGQGKPIDTKPPEQRRISIDLETRFYPETRRTDSKTDI